MNRTMITTIMAVLLLGPDARRAILIIERKYGKDIFIKKYNAVMRLVQLDD